MHSRTAPPLLLLGTVMVLGGIWRGCASKPVAEPEPSAAGQAAAQGGADAGQAGGAAGRTAGEAAGDAGATQGGTPTSDDCGPLPATVPQGFEGLPVFGCQYRVYTPTSSAHLPAPIAWQECALTGPDPYACREIAIDWPTDGSNASGGLGEASVEADGTVVLQLRRIYEQSAQRTSAAMGIVAEVDGKIRQAIWDDYADASAARRFWFQAAGVSGGKSTWSAFELHTKPTPYAGLGGADDELRVPILFEPSLGRGVPRPGAAFYAESTASGIDVKSWAGVSLGTFVVDTASAALPAWSGDSLYTSVSDGGSALRVWTKASGAVDLLAVPPDAGRVVGSLGADAEHLVWLEASEPDADPEAPFKVRDVYAATPTTNPLQLKPKRVRSFGGDYVNASRAPAVGCGYAAFQANFRSSALPVTELFIVKLSDGSAWRLRTPEGQNARYNWGPPLAITCEEVFVPMADNVRRISLASLGPALPKD